MSVQTAKVSSILFCDVATFLFCSWYISTAGNYRKENRYSYTFVTSIHDQSTLLPSVVFLQSPFDIRKSKKRRRERELDERSRTSFFLFVWTLSNTSIYSLWYCQVILQVYWYTCIATTTTHSMRLLQSNAIFINSQCIENIWYLNSLVRL